MLWFQHCLFEANKFFAKLYKNSKPAKKSNTKRGVFTGILHLMYDINRLIISVIYTDGYSENFFAKFLFKE
jgi:hypothetical protein